MRITTTMMIRNYQTNLSATTENKMNYQNKVLTQRNFTSVKEDPSAAAKASHLTRQYLKNEDYLEMSKDLQSKLDSQEDSIYQVVKYAEELFAKIGKESLNGTNLEQRETYANTIVSIRDSILQSLNAVYSNTFIMAGANGTEAPFSVDDVTGKLMYNRGAAGGTEVDDPANIAQLQKWRDEALYMDIGLGLEFNADAAGNKGQGNEIISSTAFNIAFSGLSAIWNDSNDAENSTIIAGAAGKASLKIEVGNNTINNQAAQDYRAAIANGEGKNHMANNLVDLCSQLALELLQPDEEFDYQSCDEMLTKMKKFHEQADNSLTGIGVKSDFLEKSIDRMESNELSLATQLERVVTPDMAIAITNYSYAQYAYNAALRIGVNLLSQSFLDFMR